MTQMTDETDDNEEKPQSQQSSFDYHKYLDEINNKPFLNQCDSISECHSIQRIIKYLQIHQHIEPTNIHKVFNKQTVPHLVNDFNHVLLNHLSDSKSIESTKNEYELIYNYINDKIKECKLETCVQFQRNNRDRETENVLLTNDNIDHNNNDIDIDSEMEFYIETMDTMHCFFIHSFDVGFRLKSDELDKIVNKDEDDDDDSEHSESTMIKLANLLKLKRQNLRNMRGSDSMNKSKFVTNIIEKKASDDQETIPMMDKLYLYLTKTNMNQDTLMKFTKFISSHQYDSESLLYDIMTNDDLATNSNIHKCFSKQYQEIKSFLTSVTKQVQEEQDIASAYSFGFKYDFHSAKYSDLQQELFNNNIFTIGIDKFKTTHKKAQEKTDSEYAKQNGITIEHIMSVLFYTDYSNLSYHFSSTFRSLDKSQTFEICKKRNQEYGNWSRLLSYTVNNFKSYGSNTTIYYHGISKLLLFTSFASYYRSPTSTTLQPEVAAIFAADTGAILSLKQSTNYFAQYFNVSWLSSFSNEDERLFMNIGGGEFPARQLRILSITSKAQKKHYKKSIHALTSFHYYVIYCWISRIDHKVTKKDGKIIEKLIKHKDKTNEYKNRYPIYVNKLFEVFTNNLEEVDVQLDDVHEYFDAYFHTLFVDDNLFGKFNKICGVFPNCKHITICYYGQGKTLDSEYLDYLLSQFDGLEQNNNQTLKGIVLSYILEYDEKKFKSKYEAKFAQKKWYLSRYVHPTGKDPGLIFKKK
eukprot:128620_1